MRVVVAVLFILSVLALQAPALQQAPAATTRYGIPLDINKFPQNTPKDCFASVVKAIDDRHIDYLLAQLTDPAFVDMRVKDSGGSFEEVVKEASARLVNDPLAVKELKRFLREGEWQEEEGTASVKLKDVKNRTVFLRKLNDRWFFENRRN